MRRRFLGPDLRKRVNIAQTTQASELCPRGTGAVERTLPTAARPENARFELHRTGRNMKVSSGYALPLGVRDCCDGINFAVFSRHATRIELLLFERAECGEPFLTVDLDPIRHRTGDIWHALIQGVHWGEAYAYRAHGPWNPEQGLRFDGNCLLLDPYALAIGNTASWKAGIAPKEPSGRASPHSLPATAKCLLTHRLFDWQGVGRPKRAWSDTVIYETHVRGLTIHPSSKIGRRGGFLGVVEKIPYFKELGITAVELMPVQEFDEWNERRTDPATGSPLRNYWGYNTVAFFAPKESYSTGASPGCQIDEFKTMVRELHRAGIEVILDMVFNHTAEGGENGATFNFRGLDNTIYYLLGDAGQYLDFTGCENTLNCGHPVVRDYIIDCLRYWTTEMHIDGFRFDLASVLGRDESGKLASNPPLIERIAEDPILREVKLIAEAWDAGGAFQVGSFPSARWLEWNSRFRDDVRRFWFGDRGARGAFASRLCGSADLYQKDESSRIRSVNLVTCHDGFTLNDVVSYSHKHNDANGLGNRDGLTGEISFNHGAEGESADSKIERLRMRQIKNLIATLMVSRGVPMVLGGDEFRRTQKGNNNAYCQDNEISWYNWRLLEQNREIFQFMCELVRIRRELPLLRADQYYTEAEVLWFDCNGRPVDWNSAGRTLGMMIKAPAVGEKPDAEPALCLLFNAGPGSVEFALPSLQSRGWRLAFDTSREGADDKAAEVLSGAASYPLVGMSMALLTSS